MIRISVFGPTTVYQMQHQQKNRSKSFLHTRFDGKQYNTYSLPYFISSMIKKRDQAISSSCPKDIARDNYSVKYKRDII